jgi:hypothetical protein
MPIIVKNKPVQDLKTLVQATPPKVEKKVTIADQRLIKDRFIKKKKADVSETKIVVEPTTSEQKTLHRKFVIEKKQLKGVASAENSLLINGKQKNIGRKSHYLLDMLTLDDE